MDSSTARKIIEIIKNDRDVARDLLEKDIPEDASYIWQSHYEADYNEMCLALLVAVRHQVERELVLIAARVPDDRRELDQARYRHEVENERKRLKNDGWKGIIAKLQLETFSSWDSSMKLLQILVNLYKHDPWVTPDRELLSFLNLPMGVPYAPLAESQDVKEGLNAYLGLEERSNFCDIASELLDRADQFLAEVKSKTKRKKLKRHAVSLNPDTFLR